MNKPAVRQGDLPTAAVELLHDGSPTDRTRLLTSFELLALTPGGRKDLQLIVDEKIAIAFDARKGGAGYHASLRKIVLNRTQVAVRTALDFVHEATHARFHIRRTGCDVANQTKDDYVRSILFEESRTYFHEAVVGRELVHLADAATVKQVLTVHPVQMWFQLVHGVPYHKAPTAAVLALDASLDAQALKGFVEQVRPYFQRYVEFYRNVEAAKWEIRHGLRRPEKPEVVADVLAMCYAEQAMEWKYPKRRS